MTVRVGRASFPALSSIAQSSKLTPPMKQSIPLIAIIGLISFFVGKALSNSPGTQSFLDSEYQRVEKRYRSLVERGASCRTDAECIPKLVLKSTCPGFVPADSEILFLGEQLDRIKEAQGWRSFGCDLSSESNNYGCVEQRCQRKLDNNAIDVTSDHVTSVPGR